VADDIERKVDRILLGQERLSEKIDSMKVSIDRVTEEVYVGRDGKKSILVQLSEFAQRIYHLEKKRTSPPPTEYRPQMHSEITGPVPAVIVKSNGGRWKWLVPIFVAVIGTAGGITAALLAP
jgi:hypothetical protein